VSTPAKKTLLKGQSPLQRLTARTVETGNEALKDARQLDIGLIESNRRNPRRTFNDETIEELAQDIKVRGILQPLIVRPLDDNDEERYEIVVGERRFQAARRIGLKNVPVIIKQLDDQQAEITSLIENIQREDLSLSDEASYFKMLKDSYDYSIREIARDVSKSHTYVETRLLLAGNPKVLEAVETKQIGMQKAVELIRGKSSVANLQKELDRLIKTSQSVISNDTSPEPEKPQAAAKKTIERPRDLPPLKQIADNLKLIARNLEKGKADNKLVLQALDELERQITRLRGEIR
jgi:ParB family transcriptional regulator, chromosome partitioning protein